MTLPDSYRCACGDCEATEPYPARTDYCARCCVEFTAGYGVLVEFRHPNGQPDVIEVCSQACKVALAARCALGDA